MKPNPNPKFRQFVSYYDRTSLDGINVYSQYIHTGLSHIKINSLFFTLQFQIFDKNGQKVKKKAKDPFAYVVLFFRHYFLKNRDTDWDP